MWDIRVSGCKNTWVLSAIFTPETQCAHFESFTLIYKKRNSWRLQDKDRAALAPPGLPDKALLGCAECDLQETNTCSGLQDQPPETFHFLTRHFIFLTWLTSFSKAGDAPACHTEMHSICGLHFWSLQGLNLLRAHLGCIFSPHGTQHCPDLSPPENAELNRHGVDLEIPCIQHAGVKHWKKYRHWKKNTRV